MNSTQKDIFKIFFKVPKVYCVCVRTPKVFVVILDHVKTNLDKETTLIVMYVCICMYVCMQIIIETIVNSLTLLKIWKPHNVQGSPFWSVHSSLDRIIASFWTGSRTRPFALKKFRLIFKFTLFQLYKWLLLERLFLHLTILFGTFARIGVCMGKFGKSLNLFLHNI